MRLKPKDNKRFLQLKAEGRIKQAYEFKNACLNHYEEDIKGQSRQVMGVTTRPLKHKIMEGNIRQNAKF